jgi:hypothetical protein
VSIFKSPIPRAINRFFSLPNREEKGLGFLYYLYQDISHWVAGLGRVSQTNLRFMCSLASHSTSFDGYRRVCLTYRYGREGLGNGKDSFKGARPFSKITRFMWEQIGSFHDIWKTDQLIHFSRRTDRLFSRTDRLFSRTDRLFSRRLLAKYVKFRLLRSSPLLQGFLPSLQGYLWSDTLVIETGV